MSILLQFLTGLVFGTGLLVAGMADPAREAGMRETSAKLRAMGGQVYMDAERVKKSNAALG